MPGHPTRTSSRPPSHDRSARLMVMAPLVLLISLIRIFSVIGEARGDLVFLKDGFVLQGKIDKEVRTEVDPLSGQPIWMPRGFYWVDDGARRVAFAPGQVQDIEARPYNAEYDILSKREAPRLRPLPDLREVVSVGPWNELWDRPVRIRAGKGNGVREYEIKAQHLSRLTPHFAQLDALGYDPGFAWTCCYLTSELGPDQVRTLIAAHPDFKITPKLEEDEVASRRFRLFRFLAQAGWYDHAEKELEGIRKDLPRQKDKIETAQENLKRLRAQQVVDDVNRAQRAGQHRLAQKLLGEFSEEGLNEKAISEIRTLQDTYEKRREAQKQARRFLSELPKTITDSGLRELLTAAARSIADDLDHDNVGRLESFLSQAEQAERQRQQDGKAELGPAELMALAVTGWLLGNTSAEIKVPAAQRLWMAREVALKYLTTQDRDDRRRILWDYSSQKNDPLSVEEMAQLCTNLPPPEPEANLGPGPLKLETRLEDRGRSVTYHVQLPPEYRHNRAFPVVIVLHQPGERVSELMGRWKEQAALNGYLLVAPEWIPGIGSAYRYTPEEHAGVLDVLRDLRRRFQVDSDRVFLHGWGETAKMAYDVGLAHPDLFAGVMPMGGYPAWFSQRYRRNAQYLPFYVVSGDRSGVVHAETRTQFEDWIPRGYPSMFVERRGRGQEFFDGELPYFFEWMKHKKRATPATEIGGPQGREFQTTRTTDNMFYWVGIGAINPGNVNDPLQWNVSVLPATFWGYVNRETNTIQLGTTGIRQLSVWLGRDSKGAGIIDFGARLSVRINGQQKLFQLVSPSMDTLLEDLYQRNDRQRLFLARLDFDKL